MKFKKKPVTVEAAKFYMDDLLKGKLKWQGIVYLGGDGAFIDTLEGRMKVSEGDWIIKGVKGEYYPCKPDVFERTYDKI